MPRKTRQQEDFLTGFSRAATLAEAIRVSPPRYTTPAQYLRQVAALHARSDDLLSRGLAVGCLSAIGGSE